MQLTPAAPTVIRGAAGVIFVAIRESSHTPYLDPGWTPSSRSRIGLKLGGPGPITWV